MNLQCKLSFGCWKYLCLLNRGFSLLKELITLHKVFISVTHLFALWRRVWVCVEIHVSEAFIPSPSLTHCFNWCQNVSMLSRSAFLFLYNIFFFLVPDYHMFKFSVVAWGTSVFKMLIHSIPSLQIRFFSISSFSDSVYGLILSIFVLTAFMVMLLVYSLHVASHFALLSSSHCL